MNNEPSPLVPEDNQPNQPAVTGTQSIDRPTAPFTEPPKSRNPKKKILLAISIAVALIAGGSTAYLLLKDKNIGQETTQKVAQLTLPNQPKQLNDQFSTPYFTSGYVSYDATKFEAIDTTLPKIKSLVSAVSGTTDKQVVFISDLAYKESSNSRRLLMYDIATQKTFVIAHDNSVGDYSNAKIMSNHYVVYVSQSQPDPLTSTTAIKVLDLNTGDTQTIIEDKAANLPASLCCSVSRDGLRLVIPQTDKFLIYQAGDSKPVTFTGSVQVFPKIQGEDNDGYASSQRNYGYPNIVWLDENRFMFTKSHPLSWTVDGEGSHAAIANNGLAIYDLTSGTNTEVARTSTLPIKWFTTDGNSIIFAGYMPNVSGVTDENSGIIIYKIDDYTDAESQPLELISQPDYQSSLIYDSSKKRLYVQPSNLDNYGGYNGGPSKTLQTLDVISGKEGLAEIKGFDFPRIEGLLGPDKLTINDSYGANNDYNIYDISSESTEHIFTAASN